VNKDLVQVSFFTFLLFFLFPSFIYIFRHWFPNRSASDCLVGIFRGCFELWDVITSTLCTLVLLYFNTCKLPLKKKTCKSDIALLFRISFFLKFSPSL
jgi:hypothetical protein